VQSAKCKAKNCGAASRGYFVAIRYTLIDADVLRFDVDEFLDAVGLGDVNIGELQLGAPDDYGRVVLFELDYIVLRFGIELLGLEDIG
jgi:hypothetical protein